MHIQNVFNIILRYLCLFQTAQHNSVASVDARINNLAVQTSVFVSSICLQGYLASV